MSEYLEKPKRQPHPPKFSLSSLLIFLGKTPTPIYFTVNQPLDLCLTRLQALEKQRGALDYAMGQPRIHVQLYQTDETSYEATVWGQRQRYPEIRISGSLEQQSSDVTIFRGTATTELLDQYMNVISLIAIIAISILSCSLGGLWCGVAALLGACWYIVLLASDRRNFIRFMRDSAEFGKNRPYRKKKHY